LTTIPAQSMLGEIEFTSLLSAGLLAFVLFFISTQFWRFALRFYTSASS
ncbi:MAG: ABC-2 family transporter protein, partial [Dolichospermum sp.]